MAWHLNILFCSRSHKCHPLLSSLTVLLLASSVTHVTGAATAIQQATDKAVLLQQQEQDRQGSQRLRDRTSAAPPTVLSTPTVPPPSQAGGGCRQIREVRILGVTLLPDSVTEKIRNQYQKRCIGVAEIASLLTNLTRIYVEKGWVAARVYLPQQDLSKGVLVIQVLEGKVSAIEIEDDNKGSLSLGNVIPFTIGKPLNLRDFEQALDQINRLASNHATIEMRPGKVAGETIVVFHNKPTHRWHLRGSVDSQGTKSTGRGQAAITLSLDSPMGMNDFISYTQRESFPQKGSRKNSRAKSISYILPFGYNTISYNFNHSSYASEITSATGNVLRNRGTSRTRVARLERVLYRDSTSRLNGYANLTTKDNDAFLENFLLTAASRRLTVVDIGLSVNTVFLGGALNLNIGSSSGLTLFNALKDINGLTNQDPRAQFHKWTFSGGYQHPFSLGEHNFEYSSSWQAQYANDVLYGTEQMLIGSIYSVRGYDQSSLSGDHGFYVRNEIGMRQGFSLGQLSGSYRPWIGFDFGAAWNRANGVPEGWLSGVSGGVQFNLFKGANLDLFVSAPAFKPGFIKKEHPRFWASASISF